jgi:hypothetical protein
MFFLQKGRDNNVKDERKGRSFRFVFGDLCCKLRRGSAGADDNDRFVFQGGGGDFGVR